SATGVDISKGAPGVSGAASFIFSSTDSPISTTWTLGASDVTDFLAGNLYVNIHTGQFTSGEIRGQILPSVRVNCGGTVYTDSLAQNWAADTGFSGTTSLFSVTVPIAGATEPYLYQSERWSSSTFQYQFSVPNGNYTVDLKFAEIYLTMAGQRVFNV